VPASLSSAARNEIRTGSGLAATTSILAGNP
jgi:hypothetical protein